MRNHTSRPLLTRALTMPLVAAVAVPRLAFARLLSVFDPPATVETKADLVPSDDEAGLRDR